LQKGSSPAKAVAALQTATNKPAGAAVAVDSIKLQHLGIGALK